MIRALLLAFGLAIGATALAAPGDLDPTYGVGGLAYTSIAHGANEGIAVAAQADGRIVVGGTANFGQASAITLTRYRADGSIDTAFGQGGQVVLQRNGITAITALVIQPDGRIVAGAASFLNSDSRITAIRFLPNGTLDTSFGSGGFAGIATAYKAVVQAIALQADGRILVAGESENYPTGGFVARFNTDGSVDSAFGESGIAPITRAAPRQVSFRDVAVQADGRIVVAGIESGQARTDFYVARFDAAGRLDPTFGTGGEVVTAWDDVGSAAYRLAIQPDGRIVVAGTENTGTVMLPVARYTTAGVLDASFGGGGRARIAGANFPAGVRIQASGKIIIAAVTGPGGDGVIAQLDANGMQDSTFGTSGYASANFSPGTDTARAVTLLPDGRIAIAGQMPAVSRPEARSELVALWFADGTPDRGFNGTGFRQRELGTTSAEPTAVVLQPDGRAVVAAIVEGGKTVVTRHAADGSLDTGFGSGGQALFDGLRANAIALQADGKIVVAGTDSTAGPSAMGAIRLLPGGTPDASFGTNGRVQFVIDPRGPSRAWAVAIQPDGRIVLGGCGNSGSGDHMALLRLLPSGVADSSFGGGYVHFAFEAATWDCVQAIALQPDGKVVAAGRKYDGSNVDRGFAVVRLTASGALDATFNGTGKASTLSANAGAAHAIALQPDGRIVAGGTAASSGNGDFALARFLADGTLDASFGNAGNVTLDFGRNLETITSLALLPGGRIAAAGGSHSTWMSFEPGDMPVAVFTANGALEPAFGAGGSRIFDFSGYEDVAGGVALQADGKLLIAVNAFGRHLLVRLDMAFPKRGAAKPGDLDGDGKADLLLQHTDGRLAAWLMDGTTIASSANLLGAGTGWSVTHSADFNGDGKADLLLRHTDGRAYLYLMDGARVVLGRELIGAGLGWSVSHVADLNGDGFADLLLRHADGRAYAWLMNGADVVGGGALLPAGSGWSVVRTGDLDGDGKADLVFMHDDGRGFLYLMDGAVAKASAGFLAAGSGWTVSHVGDLDGDGKADLVFRHADGRAHLFLMNGTAFGASAAILPAGSGWSVSHLGDLDGDGKSDLVFAHPDGRAHARLMNGTAIAGAGDLLPAGTGWSISHLLDLDGNGRQDLAFRHADGSITVRLMDGLAVIGSRNLAGPGGWSVAPATAP